MNTNFTVSLSLPYSTVARMLISACEGGSDAWLALASIDIHTTSPAAVLPDEATRDKIIGAPRWSMPRRARGRLGWPLYAVAPFVDGLALVVSHDETRHLIDLAGITRAVQLLATQHPQVFAEALANTWASEHADVLLQLAVFGKVRFV